MSSHATLERSPEPETIITPVLGWQTFLLWTYLIAPFLVLGIALALAVSTGYAPTWLDLGLAIAFYAISGHGVTVGYHRLLTHGSFTASRPLKIGLTIAGNLSVQGPATDWVAAHRRHHAHADDAGDPHSPWRFGTSGRALAKGLWWAQAGWLFSTEETNPKRFVPDLLADRDIVWVDRLFPLWMLVSLGGPALIGGVVTGTWAGALTAFLWAGAVRMLLLHHVTWSVNSICHVVGSRPFRSRDKSTNVWPLAVVSMGESWHNLHHADPTCARHGVDKGQVDSSAVLIRSFERLGWATSVRWPATERLDPKRVNS